MGRGIEDMEKKGYAVIGMLTGLGVIATILLSNGISSNINKEKKRTWLLELLNKNTRELQNYKGNFLRELLNKSRIEELETIIEKLNQSLRNL